MNESSLNGTRALVVEDEPLLRRRIAAFLEKLGAEVTAVGDLASARQALSGLDIDIAVLDINLPDGRSLSLFADRSLPAKVAAVFMTADGGVGGAVEAMRLGGADYVVKPFDLDDLAARIARARQDRQGKRRESYARERGRRADELLFTPGLHAVKEQLEAIISADQRLRTALAPVLIEGETGTGKTSFARWLHEHGPRAEGPFVDVNCSALPEPLAESELFGHERGAFTDAREPKLGLFEAAEGGTLFLDELPSLSPGIQAKLLKALEERVVRRVGGNRVIPVDVRIVAATAADLRGLVRDGKFREDLFHRLDLFRVHLPPLRERGQDVVELATSLAARIARQYNMSPFDIPAHGVERLLRHRWPGNVRELAHEIERSLLFDRDQLSFQGLEGPSREAGAKAAEEGWLNRNFTFPPTGFSLEGAIDKLVELALAQSEGNVSAAARLLGMPRDFVRYRVKR